jgi:ABC-type dipeptide/oligopeptide/nickel transport system permease subunit
LIGVSLPSFFAAMLLQFGLLQVTQITGRSWLPLGGVGWDEHLILPAIVLAFRPLAQIARVTFVTLSEIIDQDFVRTAHSKGLHPRAVLNKHVLRNAAVPILTTVGLSLRFSLSSLPIVEFFFGWQGLGYTLLKSIAVREDNLTLAMLLSLGSFFILINLFLDLAYRLIDPRLRDVTSRVERESRISWLDWVRKFPGAIRTWVVSIPLLGKREPKKSLSVLPDSLLAAPKEEEKLKAEVRLGRAGIRRAWIRGTVGNLPLLLGTLMVMVLIFIVAFGSELSPHSPYTTQGLKFEDGEFLVPPFPPSALHPWGTDVLGRDLQSVIFSGAQQTFILAGSVLVARLVVGFILGAIAGWWHGSLVDRLLTNLVEVIATFPMLLLAMILVLALNIRDGFRPFVIALCFVGWGEIMQFVRGEVVRIRPQLFIEGAVAVGLRTNQILRQHVLPNLVPMLISLAALEMGAVLLLLGELGFISIFIGGGMFAELSWQAPLYHYSDVPEWGALLSNLRLYARPYPWMGIYPSLGFFFAILGMNLFGEGLRRLIERVGVRIMGLFNRYTLAMVGIVILGFLYLKGNTGDVAVYRQQAAAFEGEGASSHVEALTNPILEGRALGSGGLDIAAEYLALTFADLGLQPAGEEFSYFQTTERAYQTLNGHPSLVVDDLADPLVYRQDFSLYPVERDNAGDIRAKIRLVLFGDILDARRFGWHYYPVT